MVLPGDSQRISQIYHSCRQNLLQGDHIYFVISYRTLEVILSLILIWTVE